MGNSSALFKHLLLHKVREPAVFMHHVKTDYFQGCTVQHICRLCFDLPCSMGAMGRFSHKKKKEILFRISFEKKKILLYVYDGTTTTLPGSCSQLWSVINLMSCVLNANSHNSSRSQQTGRDFFNLFALRTRNERKIPRNEVNQDPPTPTKNAPTTKVKAKI